MRPNREMGSGIWLKLIYTHLPPDTRIETLKLILELADKVSVAMPTDSEKVWLANSNPIMTCERSEQPHASSNQWSTTNIGVANVWCMCLSIHVVFNQINQYYSATYHSSVEPAVNTCILYCDRVQAPEQQQRN